VAITEAGTAVSESLARLIEHLRGESADVLIFAVPTSAPRPEPVPTLGDLKRGLGHFARGVARTLRGDFDEPGANWLESQLRAVEGRIDAWATCDPALGRQVFPLLRTIHPTALRIAVDGDYHLEPQWQDVDCDALVVLHPGLATGIQGVREGRMHLLIGGALHGGAIEPKRLDDKPMVVVSTARLDPGDVDPLLFQLSLAHPERFSLLFLPSGRPGVDELVRTRAPNYGLQGKRPKAGSATEAWIRGAAVLIGHPAPMESAIAVAAQVPQLVFSSERHLNAGDRFLIAHGAALHADIPITIAVHLEALMPQGARRDGVVKAAAELEPGDGRDAAKAVLEAVQKGRPTPVVAPATSSTAAPSGDPDLEDIGPTPPTHVGPTPPSGDLPLSLRRAYLKEIILRQTTLERQFGRAQSGLETWQKRVRLARAAHQHDLADKAVPRVEGLVKLTDRLSTELREVRALRERLSGQAPLTDADRAAVARFMSPDVAASLDRGEAPESAFAQLEINDALDNLKKRLLNPGS
jgi:hypothetical protein